MLPTPIGVCSIIACLNNDMGAMGIFNMHTYVDACNSTVGLYGHHKGVCTSGRKIPCCTWDSNPLSIVPGFSVRLSTHWAITTPFYIKMGSGASHFIVWLIVGGKVTRLSKNQNLWRGRRAEVDSNQCSSVYQHSDLPLGQTSSQIFPQENPVMFLRKSQQQLSCAT